MMHSAKLRIVVLISGSGTNLQALIEASQNNLNIDIVAVISNQSEAYGLTRAQLANIPTHIVHQSRPTNRVKFENELQQQIDFFQPDLIVLAGFMKVLSKAFVNRYLGRMINIHPSLLPKYPGLHTHEQVLHHHEKEHGASIHFVTAEVDAGPIIGQTKLAVLDTDTPATLQNRVQSLEHILYPKVISWFVDQRIVLHDQKIFFDGNLLQEPIMV